MPPRHKELARHALDLTNREARGRSYRNRFIAGPGHTDYPAWQAMVANGDAIEDRSRASDFGGNSWFYLTPQGALKAIEKGEQLDPEDFPKPEGVRPSKPL